MTLSLIGNLSPTCQQTLREGLAVWAAPPTFRNRREAPGGGENSLRSLSSICFSPGGTCGVCR